jgi:flagellar assembly factor FliW
MTASTLAAPTRSVDSLLLGPLDVAEETIITFAAGLPGFETLRDFTLVDTQREDSLWLQSLDNAGVTLLLIDPFTFVPGYTVDMPAADLAALQSPGNADELLVLCVAQLRDGVPVEANLQSPIVIRRDVQCGRQVVLPDSMYGMRYPITFT